jgi:hypothetical protein
VCNNQVCHMISEDGKLFSWGEDTNHIGILGLGSNYSIKEPLLNSNLINKRIIELALSENHCCCIDSKKF